MTLRRKWMAIVIAGSAALAFASPAAADDIPAPAPEPAPAPGQSIIPPGGLSLGTILAQTGSAPTGPLGLPDMSAYGANLLLGQNVTPAAPGSDTPAGIYPLNAFRPEYLVPLNETPAAPGEGVPAPGIGPDADSPGTGRIAFLRRLHEMYQAGELTGALLGQQPLDSWETPGEEAAPVIPPQDLTGSPPAVNIPD